MNSVQKQFWALLLSYSLGFTFHFTTMIVIYACVGTLNQFADLFFFAGATAAISLMSIFALKNVDDTFYREESCLMLFCFCIVQVLSLRFTMGYIADIPEVDAWIGKVPLVVYGISVPLLILQISDTLNRPLQFAAWWRSLAEGGRSHHQRART